MSFSSMLKRALANACFGFCALTLLYSLVMIGKYDTNANMSVLVVLLFYPLCFAVTLTNELLKKSVMSGFCKALVRYIVFLASVGLFVCFPHRQAITGTVALILFFIITIFYLFGALVYAWLTGKKSNPNTNDDYINVYKTANKK